MAIKFNYQGVEIECEGPEDAATLLKSLTSENGAHGNRPASKRQLDVSSFRELIGRLHKNQKRLVKALLSGKDIVTDHDLQEALGLDDNRAIGAILAGISKNAKKAGLTLDAILSSETKHSETGRSKQYILKPEFRKVAEEAGGVK